MGTQVLTSVHKLWVSQKVGARRPVTAWATARATSQSHWGINDLHAGRGRPHTPRASGNKVTSLQTAHEERKGKEPREGDLDKGRSSRR